MKMIDRLFEFEQTRGCNQGVIGGEQLQNAAIKEIQWRR
jgi:hypothetical protein